MLSRINNYVFPAIVALFALSYGLQIVGQRYSVVLFPTAILVLIAILLILIVVEKKTEKNEISFSFSAARPALTLIGMSLLYYFSIISLGFDLSNLWFSFVGSLVMGIRPLKALVIAVATAIVLYGISRAMDFNVPLPFWM